MTDTLACIIRVHIYIHLFWCDPLFFKSSAYEDPSIQMWSLKFCSSLPFLLEALNGISFSTQSVCDCGFLYSSECLCISARLMWRGQTGTFVFLIPTSTNSTTSSQDLQSTHSETCEPTWPQKSQEKKPDQGKCEAFGQRIEIAPFQTNAEKTNHPSNNTPFSLKCDCDLYRGKIYIWSPALHALGKSLSSPIHLIRLWTAENWNTWSKATQTFENKLTPKNKPQLTLVRIKSRKVFLWRDSANHRATSIISLTAHEVPVVWLSVWSMKNLSKGNMEMPCQKNWETKQKWKSWI